MRCLGDLQHIDATLASLASDEASLRLRLGQLLEVIGRGAVFELGFSSLGAYAVERCERSVRWAEAARCLARRLEKLPQLRRAVATAKVSWSMGELLARVAEADNEGRWLELAHCRTVRQMRALVTEATASAAEASASAPEAMAAAPEAVASAAAEVAAKPEAMAAGIEAVPAAPEAAANTGVEQAASKATQVPVSAAAAVAAVAPADGDSFVDLQSGGDDVCTLTCTVAREDAWLFEATRCLLDHLGVNGAALQAEALLAEAQGTLLASLPEGAIDVDCAEGSELAQNRWVQQLRRWRDEAEASCEKNVLGALLSTRASAGPAERLLGVALASSLGIAPLEQASSAELDQQVRALTAVLAGHELQLSLLVLRFHRADGWRRLGYATEAQYARERLGLSRSSFLARRALALRLEKLPCIAAALGAGEIGVEAASQLVRIATPSSEAAWVERARRRTVKHLREEVAAALTAVRLTGESDCPPPEDTDMKAFQKLERTVVSGQFAQPRAAQPRCSSDLPGAAASPSAGSPPQPAEPTSDARRPWCEMLGSLTSWLDGALQMSAAGPSASAPPRSSAGRVTLRLRMSRDTYRWWRRLEAQARRWLPPRVSWLRFLCLSVWHAWRHLLGTSVAYGHIYVRDRFRCRSPVCSRRDVTPHHLQFRSAGGSDEDENLVAVCTWCHLFGVHGGRIRAEGTAEHVRWELGAPGNPCLIVQDRERVAA